MNLNEKRHKKLQEKALDNAIKKLIPDIGDYYIDDKRLLFKVKDEKIELLEKLHFSLPSWYVISSIAKTLYKEFDDTVATKVVYEFSYLSEEKELLVSAKNSDIVLGYNNFTNLIINDANNVKIYADTLEKGGMNINAKKIEFVSILSSINKDIDLTSECVLFYRSKLICLKNININSDFIEFYNSEIMYSDNLYLKSSLIVSDNSKLKAQNKIEIIDTNCDEIKGVDASIIIYNGQDISYSENIIMPKLRKNLIDVLRKVRNKASTDLDNQLEIETQKLKQEFNNKPITKILKK